MMDCIFCKIIRGEISALKIYQDSMFIAILDINPRSKGHTLVIPIRHVERYEELNDEEAKHLGVLTKYLAQTLVKTLKATGYNIAVNNGESAGQVVKHLHLHIIPRYGDKGHSFEAAFPLDEEAKNNLQGIQREIGIIAPLTPSKSSSSQNSQKKVEKKEESGEGWVYDEEILDEID